MAGNDLRTLIESRIPEHRANLETSHVNLENVAVYCEDRNAAFEETKQFALQSLASVAYQINTLVVNIHKEKLSRREIGALTTNKSIQKQPKIIAPAIQPVLRYKRTVIDFSVLDEVGHGVRSEVAQYRGGVVSRAPSSVSGSHPCSVHYSQYERTANIGTNTVFESTYSSHRIQQRYMHVAPVSQHQSIIEYGAHQIGGRARDGSQDGSLGFGTNICSGTLRLHQAHVTRTSMVGSGGVRNEDRADSPGFPLPPPQLSSHYGYVGITRSDDLPPPAMQMLNSTHEDDPLPPPPNSHGSFFDANADWVPQSYIEKAIALYDYDADKPDELSLRENCIVYVLRKNEDGWFEGVLDGVTGLFPGNYVQAV
uniref:SH3 domain-containing protein n=1 Tax=Angiostrongylus cantonensis TaxID=6313 RepID=A0A158P6W0_ANGCA